MVARSTTTPLYFYTVAGKLSFPVDMLRYDNCLPADWQSVQEIVDSFTREEKGKTYKVNLTSNRTPTDGRWLSFLWCVVKDA